MWRQRWRAYLKNMKKALRFRRKVLFRLATNGMAAWAIAMKEKRGEAAEIVL
jgi:hypothetical protein